MFRKLGKELMTYFRNWVFHMMVRFIRLYTDDELFDQHDSFKVDTWCGTVYVNISRSPIDGKYEAYRTLDKKVGL